MKITLEETKTEKCIPASSMLVGQLARITRRPVLITIECYKLGDIVLMTALGLVNLSNPANLSEVNPSSLTVVLVPRTTKVILEQT